MTNILRHRPGLRTRNKDLSALVIDEQRQSNAHKDDPLLGNYQLVRQENIITAFQGQKSEGAPQDVQVNLYDINAKDEKFDIDSHSIYTTDSDANEKSIAATSADFNGKGKDEVLLAYCDKGNLNLELISGEGKLLAGPTTFDTMVDGSHIKLVTGYFSDIDIPYFVVAYETEVGILRVKVGKIEEKPELIFTDVSSLDIQDYGAAKSLANPTPGTVTPRAKAFDLATGTLTSGSSLDQLALVYQKKQTAYESNLLQMQVYDFNNHKLALCDEVALGKARLDANVAIAAGYLTAALQQDAIVTAWSDPSGKICLVSSKLDDSKKLDNKDDINPIHFDWGLQYGALALCIGDVNLDGIEEIVVGVQSSVEPKYDSTVTLRVLVADNLLNLSLATSDASTAYIYGELDASLADYGLQLNIGTLQGGMANTIVLSGVGQKFGISAFGNHYHQTNAVVQVNPKLQFPVNMRNADKPSKLETILTRDDIYSVSADKLSFTALLADTSGATIRVGSPIAKVKTANSVIAVINFPPIQYGINGPDDDGSASIALSKEGEQSQSIGLETQSTYTHSNSLNTNLDIDSILSINHSIDRTHGENFSHSTEKIKSMTITMNASSSYSDAILTSETICNTWQYPVYAKNKDTKKMGIQGYLLVIFPTQKPRTGVMWGDDPRSLYVPSHVVGNLSSYDNYPPDAQAPEPQESSGGPIDYDPEEGSFSNMYIDVGSGATEYDFSWNTQTSNNDQKSNEQTLDISTGVGVNKSFEFLKGFSLDLGVEDTVSDSYSDSKTSIHDISYTETTTISLSYDAIPTAGAEGKNYQTIPYVYWSTKGGYLKVDYTMLYSTSSWYTKEFKHSEPCFNMPFMFAADENKKAQNRLLTRDIAFTPAEPDGTFKMGETEVTIEATVRNHSLSTMKDITVQFFAGTAKDHLAISEVIALGSLTPQSSRVVATKWKPKNLEEQGEQIWCVINPESTIKSLKNENNFNGATAIDDTNTTAQIAFNRWPISVFTS